MAAPMVNKCRQGRIAHAIPTQIWFGIRPAVYRAKRGAQHGPDKVIACLTRSGVEPGDAKSEKGQGDAHMIKTVARQTRTPAPAVHVLDSDTGRSDMHMPARRCQDRAHRLDEVAQICSRSASGAKTAEEVGLHAAAFLCVLT